MKTILKLVLVIALLALPIGYLLGTWVETEQTVAYACGYTVGQADLMEQRSGKRPDLAGIIPSNTRQKCEDLKDGARRLGFDPNGNGLRKSAL